MLNRYADRARPLVPKSRSATRWRTVGEKFTRSLTHQAPDAPMLSIVCAATGDTSARAAAWAGVAAGNAAASPHRTATARPASFRRCIGPSARGVMLTFTFGGTASLAVSSDAYQYLAGSVAWRPWWFDGGVTDSEQVVTASRDIAAPAADIFEL